MLIRPEGPGDDAGIHAVQAAAFAREEVAVPFEAELVRMLRRDSDAWIPELSLVAVEGTGPDEQVVGHAVTSRAWLNLLDHPDVPALGLGPIGVLPGHQGRGIGGDLVEATVAAADRLGEGVLVLLGDPAFYRRFGFRLAHEIGITPPVAEWAPHFQVLQLKNYDVLRDRGAFRYASAFDAAS